MQKLPSHQPSGKHVFKSSAVPINTTILKECFQLSRKKGRGIEGWGRREEKRKQEGRAEGEGAFSENHCSPSTHARFGLLLVTTNRVYMYKTSNLYSSSILSR